MGTQARSRGVDTRSRIEEVALDLFCEQGYEKTSLREIADRLEVTKAALYYHFKSKEDILISVVETVGQPLTELVEWGMSQPRTLETKREILRRYGDAVAVGAPLFRVLQENHAALRDLSIKESFRERMVQLTNLLCEDGGPLSDRVRCSMALFSLHGGMLMLRDTNTSPQERQAAALEVAYELLGATESARRSSGDQAAAPAGQPGA
ncbi:TetR family transcriptional regulator [Wenjunlia vitaminophila]|uniref:TetR family transcriptional regulator n=1 Tax=Wenjunlia vitaminophila TaxID=76728 RepID=A0A0T6LS76_WENVI|nr:TetR/AcrR family transcriptional regulator [Wenjunlia vitaminophila]KRV48912.1 TetR family transcriptional regulator [Wenjunlia vitaminophila]